MASGTALGILFFCGLRYGAILAVSPFLLLAIGVDDAYLMIHAWQHVSQKMRNKEKGNDTISERIALVLIETGPSILISALANITADTVGSFTGSMEITLLCVGNIMSIIVDFFYQITFFTAALAIFGQMEMNREKADENEKMEKIPIDFGKSVTVTTEYDRKEKIPSDYDSSDSDSNVSIRSKVKSKFLAAVDAYIKLITHWLSSTLVCIAWLAFLGVAIHAMLGFEINLTTSKLFTRDSPLHKIEKYRENMVLPCFTQAQIFVSNPGNLSDYSQRQKVHNLIEHMEKLNYSYGAESSNYFLRDFETFQSQMDGMGMEEEEELLDMEESESNITEPEVSKEKNKTNKKQSGYLDLNELDSFLGWPEYDYYRGFLNMHKDE